MKIFPAKIRLDPKYISINFNMEICRNLWKLIEIDCLIFALNPYLVYRVLYYIPNPNNFPP
jgi:hypothetical protein